MRFEWSELPGLVVVRTEPHYDTRGHFARLFCAGEFAEAGLNTRWVQTSASFNLQAGTLRGMHIQNPPHAEVKLIRCSRGAIYDVAVDLRPDSATYRRWFGAELTPDNKTMLYVPEGFAHGFVTLDDATEVEYQISTRFEPSAVTGFRWDDPAFAIVWPRLPKVMNDRDASWPNLDPGKVVS